MKITRTVLLILLPLTSSGNILFSDAQALAAALDGSPLAPYAALKRYAPA